MSEESASDLHPDPNPERLTPEEVGALCVELSGRLEAFLLGVLRDRDLAAEALQATFGKAVEHGCDVNRNAFGAWMFRVGYHEALQIRRRQGIDARSLRQLSRISPPSTEPPGEQLIRAEQAERVRDALGKLPQEQQTVVHLRIYEDKTFAEIAADLSLPLGTVLTRMRLALKKLQLALERFHEPR